MGNLFNGWLLIKRSLQLELVFIFGAFIDILIYILSLKCKTQLYQSRATVKQLVEQKNTKTFWQLVHTGLLFTNIYSSKI